MKLYLITFKLSGHIKTINKGGTSIEDAFGKLLIIYRDAAKPPELVKLELLEDYGQHISTFNSEWLDWEKECDKLREKIINEPDYEGY